MFVNCIKNKSGTTSVRVLQKHGRTNVIVKSFGASRDQKEIERMVLQAREYIMRHTGTFYNLFNLPPMLSIVGYGDIGGLFRPLVLSRLVAPGSKLKAVDYLCP